MFQTMFWLYIGYTWGLLEYLDTGGVEATLHTLALSKDNLELETKVAEDYAKFYNHGDLRFKL